MANPSGAKGYRGEVSVVAHLRNNGFFRAYRSRAQGALDRGDVGGIDDVAIEIKNHGVYKFAEWMKELAREKANAAAATAALVVKPRGVGDTRVGEWWVLMTLDDYTRLLVGSGHQPHRRSDEPITLEQQ
jgi:hypothetical protein